MFVWEKWIDGCRFYKTNLAGVHIAIKKLHRKELLEIAVYGEAPIPEAWTELCKNCKKIIYED